MCVERENVSANVCVWSLAVVQTTVAFGIRDRQTDRIHTYNGPKHLEERCQTCGTGAKTGPSKSPISLHELNLVQKLQ